MRKVIVAEYVSLDGAVEAPEQWHFPCADQDMFRVLGEVNAEIDTMLLGRVTYEVFAESFADAPADDPVAAELTRPAKVVVSSTIGEPKWAKTTVLRGDVVTGVRALRDQPGSAILVNGNISLAARAARRTRRRAAPAHPPDRRGSRRALVRDRRAADPARGGQQRGPQPGRPQRPLPHRHPLTRTPSGKALR